MEDILPVSDIVTRLRELNGERPPAYTAGTVEKRIAITKIWHKGHLLKIRNYHRQRYKASPIIRAQARVRGVNRRAKEANAIGLFTLLEWRDKCIQFNYKCAYCGKRPKVLTKDHVIPISLGGENTIINIVPACRRCNSSKQARLKWFVKHSFTLPLPI